jgi:hypothetical protein
MKTTITKLVLSALVFLSIGSRTYAQIEATDIEPDTNKMVLVNLNDNFELYGVVKDLKEGLVYFESEKFGEILFETSEINWMEEVIKSQLRYKKMYNKNSDHYFMIPSAFQLRKKDAYIRSTYLLYNSFSYGLTDNISVSGGADFLHLIKSLSGNNEFGNLYFLSVKGGVQLSNKVRLGLGAYKMRFYKFDATMPLASLTLGDRNDHLTVSYGQNIQGFSDSSNSMIMAGAQKRINDKIYLVGEYIQFPKIMDEGASSQAVFSYGIRYSSGRIAFDLSMYNNKSIKNYFPFGIPLFSCTFQL